MGVNKRKQAKSAKVCGAASVHRDGNLVELCDGIFVVGVRCQRVLEAAVVWHETLALPLTTTGDDFWRWAIQRSPAAALATWRDLFTGAPHVGVVCCFYCALIVCVTRNKALSLTAAILASVIDRSAESLHGRAYRFVSIIV